MAKALVEVVPKTYHGLGTWHLMQNSIKHFGSLMKGESHILIDFKKYVYGNEDEQSFEEGWRTLLDTYDVKKNIWQQRVYNMKEKWASCYIRKLLH